MENENLDIKKSLEYIGFSEKEVVVYLALLSLGKGTVTQISRKAGINRPTGYHVLASLSAKELVKVSGKEPKQEYVAESPNQIEKLLQNKIEEDQKFINEARKIIPELKSIHNVIERPKVLFYEGKDGLQKVYEDTLTSQGDILAYASVEDVESTLPLYFPEYYKRRAKKGIKIRAIFPESPEARNRSSLDNEEMRESLIIPNKEFGFHPEINIYNKKLGIIIESAEIADAMKKIYELSWAEAKRLDKEI